MEQLKFERLKADLAGLAAGEILKLEDFIEHYESRQFAEMALARRTRQTLQTRVCPHCRSNDILLHGKDQNKRQRFRCRGCRKTYNILTGTPMARARMPEKWALYLGCMTEHMPLRTIVASGIDVHLVTAWRWRHRFLIAAANDNAHILSGVIEADMTFFRWSFKGYRGGKEDRPPESRADAPHACDATKCGVLREQVPVVTAFAHSDAVFEAILASRTGIEVALEGRIASGSVLCSDGDAAYVTVADKANAEHYLVFVPAPSKGKMARLGLGRVKNHHLRLKYLINERCRGVATKYLANYIGWHRAMIQSGFAGKRLLIQALA